MSNLADRLSAPRLVRHSEELLRIARDRIDALQTTHSVAPDFASESPIALNGRGRLMLLPPITEPVASAALVEAIHYL